MNANSPLAVPIRQMEAIARAYDAASQGFTPGGNYDAWRKARDRAQGQALASLEAIGAAARSNAHEHSVRFAGIRSSSTTGLRGAIGNWLTAARKKAA